MRPSPRTRRGVTLIEGLVSTLILLTGMVGVLQGLFIASAQNSMANRHTRASIIAQQLATAIEQQGKARHLDTGGLFLSGQCSTSPPASVADFVGDLGPSFPASLSAQGFAAANACYVDFDALGTPFNSWTPGYDGLDDTIYQRLVAVYRHPTNPEVTYIAVNVGWRDGGRVRVVKRFTALYDTTTNQTNLDF